MPLASDARFVPCKAFTDQKMGTAGLRKKVRVLAQPHYLEMFLQAVFESLRLPKGATLVVGGDGRFHNDVAVQVILRMAMAAGVRHVIAGRGGLLSTPAASCLIRERRADGGFLLTASHNPGGPDGDFGIKFNTASGGQAPAQLTDAIYSASCRLIGYRICDTAPFDLQRIGTSDRDGFTIEVVDPVAAYEQTMQQLFDFDLLRNWLRNGHRIAFEAMHGVTGPYAQRILVDSLGASAGDIWHADPRPDFGGLHPDPNPVDAHALVDLCTAADAPDLAAASDGDGDRNMILAHRFLLSPGDSIAMILANADCVPGFRNGISGVARSMPTSRALDAVAAALGISCYETPTGWRYFCNLLESGRIDLCGEESFGTGSSHAREKDGLWAVLCWMSVLAKRNESLPAIATAHWRRYGRHYYQRHDYEIDDAAAGEAVVAGLRDRVPAMPGTRCGGAQIAQADDFHYRDPVDGSESARQGIRVIIDGGRRIVYRLSGTGTTGATLRVYLEQHEMRPERLNDDPDRVLAPLGTLARETADIERVTGLGAPSTRI
ncbi:MAG: alpha-D-glucose phosphate-specific phosphoglucomutase [Gammaproteobacteria bacterium]|nr:alpha-D-glucose phosphate-specific phosphoglucomutase [Gammaproteobacteria bacterium]